MAITIKSIKGYYFLDAWIFANIIQQATLVFCKKYLNLKNDPCGRMFDQMTMAARSAVANIAEGSSRRQTSKETEMKLTDVARASLSELLGDYFSFSLTIIPLHTIGFIIFSTNAISSSVRLYFLYNWRSRSGIVAHQSMSLEDVKSWRGTN